MTTAMMIDLPHVMIVDLIGDDTLSTTMMMLMMILIHPVDSEVAEVRSGR